MFNLSELVVALNAGGIIAELDVGKEPSLANLTDLGRVQVGYHTIKAQSGLGDGVSSDSCLKLTQDLSFVFYTQFTCNLADFPTFWDSIYAVVTNWIPTFTAPDQDYTATFLEEGGKKGMANGRIWWIDYWQIDFPRVQNADI